MRSWLRSNGSVTIPGQEKKPPRHPALAPRVVRAKRCRRPSLRVAGAGWGRLGRWPGREKLPGGAGCRCNGIQCASVWRSPGRAHAGRKWRTEGEPAMVNGPDEDGRRGRDRAASGRSGSPEEPSVAHPEDAATPPMLPQPPARTGGMQWHTWLALSVRRGRRSPIRRCFANSSAWHVRHARRCASGKRRSRSWSIHGR